MTFKTEFEENNSYIIIFRYSFSQEFQVIVTLIFCILTHFVFVLLVEGHVWLLRQPASNLQSD